jgi:Ca2+-binding EF-hand superfamily protein
MTKTLINSSLIALVAVWTLGLVSAAQAAPMKGNLFQNLMAEFSVADADSNGVLSSDELAEYSKRKSEAKIAEMDTNTDGEIDAAELTANIKSKSDEMAAKRAAKMIEKLDADGNGTLSTSEFPKKSMPNRIFNHIDANDDGALSANEIATAADKMSIKVKHGGEGKGEVKKHKKGWFSDGNKPIN